MKERIKQLNVNFQEEMKAVKKKEDVEKIRITYLGKKGFVTEIFNEMKKLNTDDKKEIGREINVFKNEIERIVDEYYKKFEEKELEETLKGAVKYDFSIPSPVSAGTLHPITIVQRQVEEIFKTMGFIIEDGLEIQTEFDNFESVNTPKNHPARDMQDTYYLENGQLLKTHTSAAQNYIMRKYGAPKKEETLKVLFPGRCFRNENIDASHENTFFQMEGMMIGEDISIANLIYFMKLLLSEVFKKEVKVRLRPGYFPFVEPGFELDINCLICGGKGCPTCKHSGWLELLPCGMIHPNVLRMGGIDPDQYTGFAFGLGLTRLTMMKYEIKDIRIFNSGNLRILRQFKDR
ncbi:phenylalanine--tRNA ligase subunit alpha [Anaerocolumna sedimenticola]|uniref:Phenylalanine--tRNA ligase alpha subunit n=1 Tax=Anaerocolumna sedimenticola TaxID=2696063 RepID=A0A6P1TPW1_9FIRM|nr:phenylalanine--tRNA ligase subunit alpha [Anaerocolumna sedimenticola]QHQ62367.1 phenylalanine--tRNA ligase subunit alpha [Anaerocolumna sedimenticola]